MAITPHTGPGVSPEQAEVYHQQIKKELNKGVDKATLLNDLMKANVNSHYAEYMIRCAIASSFQDRN